MKLNKYHQNIELYTYMLSDGLRRVLKGYCYRLQLAISLNHRDLKEAAGITVGFL